MLQGDGGDDGGGGGWLSGWIQAAKEKSTTALTMVKRDLAEFTTTMHDDGIKVASTVKEKLTQENATAATQKVKEGVTSLLGGISKALVVEPDDDYQMARIVGGEAVVFDRYQARLHAIQIDPSTYTAEPSPPEAFSEWVATFDLESAKGSISELLVSNVEVRALYTQLVPLTVSNVDFWCRYYFKQHQLEQEEARRVELMKRADDVQGEKLMGWDEDDDEDWTEARGSQSQSTASPDDTATQPPSSTEILGQSSETKQSDDTATGDLFTENKSPLPTTCDPISADKSAVEPVTSKTDERSETLPSEPVKCSREDIPVSTVNPVSSDEAAIIADQDSAVGDAAVSAAVSSDRDSTVSSHSSEPSGWSALSSETAKSDGLVVVGVTPERTSPSDEGSNAKESLDEDWEKDFDVEVTEQDLQAAKERLKNMPVTPSDKPDEKSEDWEDW